MPVSEVQMPESIPGLGNGESKSGVRPIAVVGMACRFPQEADNPEKLWQMLLHGRSASEEFPAHKFKIDSHYHPDPSRAGSMSLRGAHFLKDSGHTFDAPFFNISKTEALTMDPQQRLLMENVYEALENAGMSVESVTGSNTSVFVGAFTNDYHTVLHVDPDLPAKYAPTGNSNSILSNRVSWFYDFQGCSLTLDTACSSSLVATHLACENLRSGSSELSIVGGVNVIEYPSTFYDMSALGFLSPDGKCYSFDHRANGYARGEGAGALILKPLDAAIRDGNTIRAVIRNTGVNQDGRTPGMTIPSKAAQEKLIRSVYGAAGLDLASASYVETHGTGTAQGDPKEAGAIAAAWAERKVLGKEPLYLGAIKSNIGHLEGASGIAGIIKTVHVLEKAIIPPNINFEKVNPSIPAEEWGIQFPVQATPFPDVEVRRASINSFGFGGTNAHILLDDAYNFARMHNIQAIHRSAEKPPTVIELPSPEPVVEDSKEDAPATEDAVVPVSNGTESAVNSTNGTNGTNGAIHDEANGVSGEAHANGTAAATTLNDTNGTNGTNGTSDPADHTSSTQESASTNGVDHTDAHTNGTNGASSADEVSGTNGVNVTETIKEDVAQANGTNGTAVHTNGNDEAVVHTNGTGDDAAHTNGTDSTKQISETNGTAHTDEVRSADSQSVASVIPKIFVLSSFDENGVKRTTDIYSKYLSSASIKDEGQYLDDMAYTLAVKRTVFSWKAFAIASSVGELAERLPKAASTLTHSRKNAQAKAGFIFTGQGAQWHAMGRDLLVYPVFRQSMEAATAFLKQLGCGWDLLEELSKGAEESKMNTPTMSQSACTALQVALVDLLSFWGVRPARVVGHSSGEIAAAYCAGAFTRESAWKIAYYRGVVSEKLGNMNGAMMAVGTTQDVLEPYLEKVNSEIEGELTMACFNSPKNITVSGDEKKIDRLGELLKEDDLFNRKLNVRNAYHSGHMRSVAEEYESLIGTIEATVDDSSLLPENKISMYSTVSGKAVELAELCSPQYWVANMVSPVSFTGTLMSMCSAAAGEKSRLRVSRSTEAPVKFLVEIGPHPALQSAIKDTFASDKTLASLPYTYLVQRNKPAVEQTLQAIGKLFCGGYPVDVDRVNASSLYTTEEKKVRLPRMLTDLPPYSFNHNQEYWPESRYCKNFRFRKHGRLDLLGAPVMDWNPAEPKWRQFVRVSENPWIKDHKVTGRIVYPGVGYIVMVLEAVKQLAEDRDEKVAGFVLRDITIKAALQIPESEEGAEVLLAMSAAPESSVSDSNFWKSFKISSFNVNTSSWTEHCRGLVKTELEASNVAIDNGRERAAEADASLAKLQDCRERCNLPFDMSRSYSELETIGLTFGPLFKNLVSVSHCPDSAEAIGVVKIPDVAASMPKKFLYPHLIHPTTMDSMIHTFLAAVQGSSSDKKVTEPMVPVQIKEVRIAADLNSAPGTEFQTYAIASKTSHRRFEANIHSWDPETSSSKVQFRGVQFVPLQSGAADIGKRQINFNVVWKPDMDLMSNEQCRTYLAGIHKLKDFDMSKFSDLLKVYNLSAIIYILDALENLKDLDEESLPSHLQKYLVWMKYQRDQYEQGKIMHQQSEWGMILGNETLKQKVLKQVEETGSEAQMAARIGKNITQIMRKEVDALQLMFGDGLMDRYYREIYGTENIHEQFRVYLDTYGLKAANLKVLEIGAGTGGTTWPILEALCPSTGFPRVAKYTYSDISPGFFEKAKSKFKAFSHVLEFKKLDIEKDPLDQGYEAGAYDMIIGANVLHATKDMNNTLTNVKTLLKPGGKLLLQEATQPRLISGPLVFGTLPGWWLSKEDFRSLCPLMSEPKWDEVLRSNGFSGTDLVLTDYEDPNIHAQTLMVSTKPKKLVDVQVSEKKTVIVAPESMKSLASEVAKALQSFGVTVEQFEHWYQVAALDLQDNICVVLHELGEPVFPRVAEDDFQHIRTLLSNCGGLLWVTKDHMEDLETSLSTGLIRSIRWERDMDESNLVLLQLSAPDATVENATTHIARIYNEQFVQEDKMVNSEYKVENGIILVNRLSNADYLDEYILSRSGKIPAAPRAFGADSSRALKLTADTPGLLNTLQFVDCPVFPTDLEAHDVEVEIKATGLNFRDIMASMGEVKGDTLGAEGSGIVTRVGSSVTSTKPGDRVALLASKTGCFQNFARTVDIATAKIPDSMTFEQAACIPVVGATVLYCLKDLARLSQGESVLVHAAAGGVGQAAIMYAQSVGAEVYATVSNEEKKKVLTETYHIPEDHIFSSRDASFAKGIMRQTKGRGVDVILNSLAGEFLRLSWQCIAHFGRFVEIGKRDIYSNGALEMFPFSRNVTFSSADLETVMARDQKTTARLLTETIELWHQGVFKETTPLNIAPFSKIEECFRMVQAGKHIGKLVLTAGKDDMVPVVPPSPPEYQFNANATYVLSGGLGGLGRSTARWMVSRGARHLVFFSRSGASTDEIREFVRELEGKGANVKVFACDVSKADLLKESLAVISESMPPIKGCIQGAMQLKDSAFENMRHDSFLAAIHPKVMGSWNLHEQLPKDMDFYIMLSSICGIIGNRGQSNYAAGNTYQDALAHWRVKNGLAATTVDLGSMLSVGFIAEHKDTVNPFALAIESIREDEYHAVLEHHIDPRNAHYQVGDCAQVAIGLATKAAFASKGVPEPSFMQQPLFRLLRSATDGGSGGGEEEDFVAMRALLRAAKSIDEASSVILDVLSRKLSTVMALPLEDIDPAKPIHYYGVDSLVAVELRNWLGKNMESQVEILDIMGDDSMAKLCDKVAKNSKIINLEAPKE